MKKFLICLIAGWAAFYFILGLLWWLINPLGFRLPEAFRPEVLGSGLGALMASLLLWYLNKKVSMWLVVVFNVILFFGYPITEYLIFGQRMFIDFATTPSTFDLYNAYFRSYYLYTYNPTTMLAGILGVHAVQLFYKKESSQNCYLDEKSCP